MANNPPRRACRSSARFNPMSRGRRQRENAEPVRRSQRLLQASSQQQEETTETAETRRESSPTPVVRNVFEVPGSMTGPSMLADVITNAVLNAYRDRRPSSDEPTPVPASVLDPPLLDIPDAGEENSFFRFVRMPVILPSSAQEVVMPMFIVGYRTQQEVTSTAPEQQTLRRSPRLRELRERTQQRQYTVSRWIIYFISGVDSPSYEDLVASWEAERRSTGLTVDQIQTSAPQQPFSAQVAASIIGSSERCHICLEKLEDMEDVRVLLCQHGFHQECIDKWLVEGQNRCPLCREAAVPIS
ncbi:hypothetical protein BJV82DRAFT_591166 [Fennellomyces sp. T-0311]|nr:hypothetical protein BJV82DRAFT_591166 [Fennellomyces sp. T-0311]